MDLNRDWVDVKRTWYGFRLELNCVCYASRGLDWDDLPPIGLIGGRRRVLGHFREHANSRARLYLDAHAARMRQEADWRVDDEFRVTSPEETKGAS